jgi:hypothetical protein
MKQYNLEHAAAAVAHISDAAIFPSAYVRDKFFQFAGPTAGRSVVRPQGLYRTAAPHGELTRLRETTRRHLGIPLDAQVVLGVASGDLRKGMDLWPILAHGVLAKHPDTFFVWVGYVEADPLLWIRHDMETLGHAGRLMMLGVIEDLNPLYAMADVYLLTSREDPFPSVVLEAMAHGLPVVAFESSGGITDLVREGSGLLVPYLDTQAMIGVICQLMESAEQRNAMGDVGRKIIARDFHFPDYGFDLLQVANPALYKVSVIVPNYNYARFLTERLESIWSQTYPVFEIIVLDDASTDDSVAMVAEIQRRLGRRIRLVRNEVNSGSVSRQWALGVALARGELVWIAEADDFADPGFLAATVEPFRDQRTVLSYCQSRQVDNEGNVLANDYIDYVSDINPVLWQQDYQRGGKEEIEDALSVKNTIPNVSAVVFRRRALSEVLQLHLDEMTELRNVADWLCYLRLMTKGSISFNATSLNNHRRHEASVTISASDRRHLQEIIMMQQLSSELATVSPERLEAARRWRGVVARQFGIDEQNEGFAAASDLDYLVRTDD